MKGSRRLRIFGILLGLVGVQGLMLLVYRYVEDGRDAPVAEAFLFERVTNRLAPDLMLADINGKNQRLSGLRGKVILLHFWATWCPPCREELPGLLKLGRELAHTGQLQVIAVSVDSDWEAIRKFFDGDVPPEVVRDEIGAATNAYGLSTMPDTYLIGVNGSIRLRFHGARDWQSKRARDILLE